MKNDRNPGKWVLIREYSSRAFQWIPTWKGFDDFQENLHSYALDESSLSIGRVNSQVRGCRFKSAGSPLAGWHGRYTNVHLCGCLSIVLLQLKVPLKLFVKSREFLTDYMFLLRHNMTEADESNVKTNFLPPDILIFVLFGLHTIFILSKIWLKQGCRYYSLSLTSVFSSNIFKIISKIALILLYCINGHFGKEFVLIETYFYWCLEIDINIFMLQVSYGSRSLMLWYLKFTRKNKS